MGNLATYITVKGERHKLHPVERSLTLGEHTFPVRTALDLDGGLILGEGDTGKTTFADIICDAARADGQQARRIPIRTQHTWQALRERVPDLHDGETATLVFDGLDEFPDCACDLADLAEELPQDRYRVWVTSRACPAASTLCHRSGRFDSIYRLARFTEDDVRTLAKSVGLDGDDFIDTVHASNLNVYLEKPGSVVLLLQLFANGELTRLTRAEFMEKISRAFARETRDGEIRDEPSPYSEHELVDAVGWVAACLELGGKSAVWTDTADSAGKDDLPLEELLKGPYGKALIREAFRRRSFEPLSDRRLRVTYSEMSAFLAGRWIAWHVTGGDSANNPITDLSRKNFHNIFIWAVCHRPELGMKEALNTPEAFLSCHGLIRALGFKDYLNHLAGRPHFSIRELSARFRRAQITDNPSLTGSALTRPDLAGLTGFKDFADFLLAELGRPAQPLGRFCMIAALLTYCPLNREKAVDLLVSVFVKLSNRRVPTVLALLANLIVQACGSTRPKSLQALFPHYAALRKRYVEQLMEPASKREGSGLISERILMYFGNPRIDIDRMPDEVYCLVKLLDPDAWRRVQELQKHKNRSYRLLSEPFELFVETNDGKQDGPPPSEREVAAILDNRPDIEKIRMIFRQQMARGLPYVALRQYLDRLFEDVEAAIAEHEAIAAYAIQLDTPSFLAFGNAIDLQNGDLRRRMAKFIARNWSLKYKFTAHIPAGEATDKLLKLIASDKSLAKHTFHDLSIHMAISKIVDSISQVNRLYRAHPGRAVHEDPERLTPAEIAAFVPAAEVKAKAAFPFITCCDPHAEIFQMKVKLSNGHEADHPFRICGEEKWHYLKQFAKAKESRVTLTPYRKGKRIALTLVFRKTHDDAPQLLRFIRSTKGSKAVYWLEQTQKKKEPAKNPNRPGKSSL